MVCLFSCTHPAPADIYTWEWIDPSDTSLGKRESMTLAPDVAGLTAEPGLNARDKDLTQAYLIGADLIDASFYKATLAGADFTDSKIRGASFGLSDFAATQLYSTASYIAGDLAGTGLSFLNAADWNFSGLNLSDAYLYQATLTNADFSGANLTNASLDSTELANASFEGAEIRDANLNYADGLTAAQLYSTASYQLADLTRISLSRADLTGMNFAGITLHRARFVEATLTDADFSGADLTDAFLDRANLTNADFTNAEISGVSFNGARDFSFTLTQLASTATYHSGDLSGIGLGGSDLTGGDFTEMNLTNASFYNAILANADFSNAEVSGASFSATTHSGFTAPQLYATKSYQMSDLTGLGLDRNDLTGWNFTGQKLTDASFAYSTLTSADFTDAEIRGAIFFRPIPLESGLTSEQLYSTASYQVGDLSGIDFRYNDLTGWNFTGQRLTDVNFSGTQLTNANFSRANLAGTNFHGILPTELVLVGSDTRAAYHLHNHIAVSANVQNLIHPDGHVEGLDILANETMRLWDYNRDDPIPIVVQDMMAIDADGTLRVVFEDDDWGSTIFFDAGIPVSLDGTLELLFDDVDPLSLVGTTFELFDWTGVSPVGTFAAIATAPGVSWDTSDLYSTGSVTLLSVAPGLDGDFDGDGDTDGADFFAWQRDPSIGDLADWQANFGASAGALADLQAVPEPGTLLLIGLTAIAVCGTGRVREIPLV